MAYFVQMMAKSGVYPDENFMVVPDRGFNLCYLREGKEFKISHDARLDVREVQFEDIERIAKDYMSARAGGYHAADRLLGLRTAMYHSVGAQVNGKLLKVQAKGTGIPVLLASNGSSQVKLDVGIMRRKEFTVAFKLLKHRNAAGATVAATRNTPADAREWVERLNWIFGAQANVYFKLLAADWMSVEQTLSQPMNSAEFQSRFIQHKHPTAQLTCFLVGKYRGDDQGAHAAGTFFTHHRVCVLDDGPHSGLFADLVYDSFTGVMAHEFAHFLGGAHHTRRMCLMSGGTETLELDKQLVIQINNW